MAVIPRVKSCCCCIRVRTGALILGWFMTIAYTICSVYYLVQSCTFESSWQETITTGMIGSLKLGPEQLENLVQHKSEYKALVITLSLLYAVGAVAGVLLLLGVYRRNAKFVLFCLIVCGALFVVGCLGVLPLSYAAFVPDTIGTLGMIGIIAYVIFAVGK